MATLALSIGGAVAGNAIGGPLGGRVGFLAGQFLGSAVFGTGDDRKSEGPRLTDLAVTSSAYGRPIPIVYGRFRVGGNVVWSPGLREHRQEETPGGKGGGASQTTVTYRYTADFRVALCEGPAAAILRIWADGKLIADFTGPLPIFASKVSRGNIRLYLGSETQQPDPAEQADRGIDNTPAYRGQVGIVFDDVPLEDFGNRIPQITAEVAVTASDALPVASAVAFAAPVTQLARWSADRRFLFTLDAVGNATKWDTVAKREIIGATVAAGGSFCPGLDSDGNLYSRGTTGKIAKFDDNWGALGTSATAMSQSIENLTVAGLPGFERVIAQGTSGAVGVFLAQTLALLNEVKLIDFAAPTAGSGYTASANRNGMAIDGDGAVWTLVVDGLADGYLFKIDPSIGTVLERHVLPGRKSARYLSYDAASNSLLVEENDSDGLLRFNLDSAAVDATLSLTLSATVDNRAQFAAGPLDGRLWLQSPEGVAYEIDTRTFKLLRTVSASSWSGVAGVEQMVYDAVNHALIWLDVLPTPTVFWTYLDRKNGLGVPLKDIVGDISARTGLDAADIDTAGLTDSVVGFVVSDRMSARAALEPLAATYLFDVREEDFKVEFVVRGGAPSLTVAEADLGARRDDDDGFTPLLSEQRTQEIELPRRLDMTYADPESDFQTGVQSFQRIGEAVATRKRITIDVPIALSRDEAAQRVEKIGYLAWLARTPFDLTVSRKHGRISPGDVIQAAANGVTFTLRVETVAMGADGVIRVRGVSENTALYASTAAGAAALAVPDQTVTLSGSPALYLMDTPLFRDADEGLGIYVAAGSYGSASWQGASIYKSADGFNFATPVTFVSSARNAVHGRAESVLPDHGARTWDRSGSITVRLFRGALSSATELAVLNGANGILVGDEVIQFADAQLNGDGSYTLRTLLRGRRGTEWATAGHAVGERVVALTDTTVLRTALADAELNAARFYKAVTVGGTLAEGTQKSLTFLGRSLMPYAPVHVTGAPAGSPADWTVNWVRRSRLGGAWKDGADIPLGEESEAYEVDILNGGGVARTITATPSAGGSVVVPGSRQATYTAADQIADFGSPATIITVRIHQLSASVGRGFPAQATLAA